MIRGIEDRSAPVRRLALCAAALYGLACVLPAARADCGQAAVMYESAPVAYVVEIAGPPESLTLEERPFAPEPPEEAENEGIESALLASAHVIERCSVTHYDLCVACCGKTDGITASGVRATPYVTCSVDPDVIPLGSDLLVDYGDGELHYYRADDTGVRGNCVDLCVFSHEEAIALGVRSATVYWVEQGG